MLIGSSPIRPWGNLTLFLDKCLSSADNVVLLMLQHHFWTRKRIRIITDNGFLLNETLINFPPKEMGWPQFAFSLGITYFSRTQQQFKMQWKYFQYDLSKQGRF
jgi:hypothetical protein